MLADAFVLNPPIRHESFSGKDDFNFKRFTAASPVYFETYYGKHDDGDVTKTENITSFAEVCYPVSLLHLLVTTVVF